MSSGADIVKPIGTLFTAASVLAANPRPYHIAVDWSLPQALQSALGNVARFNIYRCGPGSGDCTPSSLIATVPANQYSYADTSVQPGQTYCYAVTYLYDDCQGGLTESPLSNIACGQICTNGCPQAEILITGNNSSTDEGSPIETYDFADGSLVHSFVPASGGNGRGLAVYSTGTATNIYYTEISGLIHVCPYGTEGSGGPDDSSKAIPNPDQRVDAFGNTAGIAALAFHYDPSTAKTELYALTGYGLSTNSDGSTNWPEVWEIDPDTKQQINVNGTASRYITVQTPLDPSATATKGYPFYSLSDGFAVLTNGDFLINDYDGADASTTYREYSGTTGALVPPPPSGSGLQIDLSQPQYGSLSKCTGVAIAPDGSLYFMASFDKLVHTDSRGDYLGSTSLPGVSAIEDIDVLILQ